MSDTAATSTARYRAYLPGGWARLDLREPVRPQLATTIDLMLEGVPTQTADSFRGSLEETLFSAATGLAGLGVEDVYLPAANPSVSHVLPILTIRNAASLISAEDTEPIQFLTGLLAAEDATVIEPVGMLGVRLDRGTSRSDALLEVLRALPLPTALAGDVEAEAASIGWLTRTVEYYIGQPGADDRWLLVTATFSIADVDDHNEVLEAVAGFADRWVEAICWVDPTPA